MRCAVIGSTGCLRSRLVPRLLARGDDVTVLVRSPRKLALCSWGDEVDVVPGSLEDYGAAVRAALGRRRDGVESADRDPSPAGPDSDRPAALALASDPVGSGGATWRWSTTAHGAAPPTAVWSAVQRIGGDTGWYAPPGVFSARGGPTSSSAASAGTGAARTGATSWWAT